ncbi:MAG: CTP synthase [Chloroflexi bacterium]|nr:CTP synthase [Chloroflexota bacterium]MBU1749852.1 CTP synthase [Chloroflexota bacterium]
MTSYIFVTGGVVSSVGKGVTVASIGRLLVSRGVDVSIQKLDPYINVDPGTMSPYQHGEVFVTDDGAETDLDLGHYERFTGRHLTQASNVTSGQVYSAVIARERRGDFLGGTIQVVPHITDEMKHRIRQVERETGADVVIVEIGGTVGDIESLPFLEAIRQMRKDMGRDNTVYIHVTLLPYIAATGELKTKPTQHSVKELRSIGIQPDVVVLRSDYPIEEEQRAKVSLFCDVDPEAVIPLTTVDTIYAVPLVLEEAGLGRFLTRRLALRDREPDLNAWRDLVARIQTPKPELNIAIVGKYVSLPDAYMSVREALLHAGVYHGRSVKVHWIDSEEVTPENVGELLRARSVSGVVVPGGFGPRGIAGKIAAAQYAREHRLPYLGLCLGMQVMAIEYARHVLGWADAHSTEFDPDTTHPVLDLMPDQRDLREMGGTMRLGVYPCRLVLGTRAAAAYGVPEVHERHRHRYEVNNAVRDVLAEAGLIPSGLSPDGRLVEVMEVVDHPWMVGSQFHPEFTSRPERPHPLFRELVAAACHHLRDGDQRPLPLNGPYYA